MLRNFYYALFLVLLSACFQPKPEYQETPPVVAPSFSTTVNVEENENYAVVKVFYATDRKGQIKNKGFVEYGGERGELKYGVTEVSIPRGHKMGELEAPSILRLEFNEDPEKHIMVLDVTEMNATDFFNSVAKKVGQSEPKNAFIFIHGYNVTFEDASRRTAQISYDLAFPGAPVLYSWPSDGDPKRYTLDEADIKWTELNLEHFLADFAARSEAENIYLIAHSMGNRAATQAYINFANNNPQLAGRFTEIILTAPDIDADVFKRDIAPKMVRVGNPVTLYASSNDLALKASKKLHGYPRAGDSGDDIVVVPGLESIDATRVETGFLGHSYFADEKSVISDMYYMIHHNLRAERRSGLEEIDSATGKYWAFKK